MDEHEKIEKSLKEFREARDRALPADRRLLPVHKDRLLAEARRRYSAKPAPAWIAFFRPAVRWAMVVAPVLILALAGYFWIQNQKLDRAVANKKMEQVVVSKDVEGQVALLDRAESLGAPGKHEERSRALRKEDMDTVSDLSQVPAESSAGERSYDEAKKAPAAPAAPTSTFGLSGAAAAGGMIAQNEPAQMAMLNLSGQYRTQVPARDQLQVAKKVVEKSSAPSAQDKAAGKDEKNADAGMFFEESRRAKVGNAPEANFSNFKLTQSADNVTLVDADGSVYVGRMIQTQQTANQLAAKQKTKTLNRQDVASPIQQASLIGTNRVTREVVNLVANFYVEAADQQVASEIRESDGAMAPEVSKENFRSAESVPQKRQNEEKLSAVESPKPVIVGSKPAAAAPQQHNGRSQVQNVQAPIRVSVVIERMDLKNNRQKPAINAERFAE